MEILIIGSALRQVRGDQKALGLTFVRTARTAPNYRLYEIDRQFAALVEVEQGGISASGELCRLSDADFETLLKQEPPGLKVAPVKLEDGTEVPCAVSTFATLPPQATDISEYGDFLAFLKAQDARKPPSPARSPGK